MDQAATRWIGRSPSCELRLLKVELKLEIHIRGEVDQRITKNYRSAVL